MQNEILKPVLATDETAIPRYDIVNPDGSVAQQNVELRLKNEVMQQGTPYDEESVLPATLCAKLGLPNSATPANAFEAVLAKAGAKVSMNEPTSQDNIAAGYSIGALWLRIPFTLTNRSFLATAQEFVASACTVEKTNQTFVLTGNGDDKILSATYALSYTDGWLYAKISVDATATSASVTIGDYTVQLTPGNTNSICIKYTGNAVAFSATYATANAESSGVVTIENFTVLDKDAVMQSGVDANSDITTNTLLLQCSMYAPFNELVLATRLWQHCKNGVWELIYGVEDVIRTKLLLSAESNLTDALNVLSNYTYMASYLAFIAANNDDSVSAALGKNNPDVQCVGLALTKYELFKDPSSTITDMLKKVRTVDDLFGSAEYILALEQAPYAMELLKGNSYTAPYFSLENEGVFCSVMAGLAGIDNYNSINTYKKLTSCFSGHSTAFEEAFAKYPDASEYHKNAICEAFFTTYDAATIFNTQALVDTCLDIKLLATFVDDKEDYRAVAVNSPLIVTHNSGRVKGAVSITDKRCFMLTCSRPGPYSGPNMSASISGGMAVDVVASNTQGNGVSFSGIKAMYHIYTTQYDPYTIANNGGAAANATYIPHS